MWFKLVIEVAKEILKVFLDVIVLFKDCWQWCCEPFEHLILSPKRVGVWMLEIWPVDNEH